jgi:integrase
MARNRALPPNLYINAAGYYYFRNPFSKATKGLGKDKARAIQEARAANAVLATQKESSLADWVAGKKEFTLRDWLPEYRKLWLSRMAKPPAANTVMAFDLTEKKIAGWDLAWMRLGDFKTTHIAGRILAEQENNGPAAAGQLRSRLSDLFRTAESQGHIPQGASPVSATYAPKKVVKRERLTLEQFLAIRECANTTLQRAMNIAILTGQRREDIVDMQFSHARDGCLHVIQGKSQGSTRLQIDLSIGLSALNMTIGDAINACVDGIKSDYMLHHQIAHGKARAGQGISCKTLTTFFGIAREKAGVKAEDGRTPPTFHEIRSLAQRLYREQYGPEFAKALLGHKNAATTEIYNDLRGQGWQRVSVP